MPDAFALLRFPIARVAFTVGPVFVVHLALVAVPFVEFTVWSVVTMLVVSRLIGLGVTAGFHRCLTHHSFKTSRGLQFVLAAVGCAALQKGPLWWAAQHRLHHKHSDTPDDPHSPVAKSFWHAHFGWLFTRDPGVSDTRSIRDLTKYPELVWLDRLWVLPGLLLAAACYALLGWNGLVYGYCLTTVLVLHVTFAINSVAHLFGRQRFGTGDGSRNNAPLGILALGEGWHNNHHRAPHSARHGFAWYEFDETYVFIRVLARLGVVWDVKLPPPEILKSEAISARQCSRLGT
ncbi:Fatty acid desaturase [Gemmata sp. SH-PL17]|uniref:acyl-CoA desaturase n=1 Tax=Gemmata sp. SH-PL17 TaxID=1630693 RepID=UPI0004B5A677|nr:acyl-CoA desaturase [Gemmata sp. SH-PL17]AMV26964.1 Fatty acid desaturase [Gemmata sp. SH-PL17]